jgi:hypothetical protein
MHKYGINLRNVLLELMKILICAVIIRGTWWCRAFHAEVLRFRISADFSICILASKM